MCVHYQTLKSGQHLLPCQYVCTLPESGFCRQPQCKNCIVTTPPDQLEVENEFHFLMHCNQYDHLRSVLFSKLSCPQFEQMNDQNKFCYMLTCPQVARIVGQFIIDAFDARPVP